MVYVVLRGHVYLRKSGAMGRFTAQMAAMSPSPAVGSEKNLRQQTAWNFHRLILSLIERCLWGFFVLIGDAEPCRISCRTNLLIEQRRLQPRVCWWSLGCAVFLSCWLQALSQRGHMWRCVCVLVCSKNITHRSLLVILNLKSRLKQLITAV